MAREFCGKGTVAKDKPQGSSFKPERITSDLYLPFCRNMTKKSKGGEGLG